MKPHPAVFVYLLLLLGLCALPLSAAPTSFGETTTVLVVEVPVNVVKDGAPVRGLGPESFVIYEGKRPQELVSFEVVDLATIKEEQAQVIPIEARRYFLLLFDLSFSGTEALAKASAAARGLVDRGLHPSDLVGVGVYGLSTGAGLLVGFTSDRAQVEKVLDAFDRLLDRDSEPARPSRRGSDPLRLLADDFSGLAADIGRAAGVDTSLAREFLDQGVTGFIAENLADMDRVTTPRLRERRRSQVQGLTRSLSGLAKASAGLDGRKYLVYFSEGFDNTLMFEEGGARTLRDVDEMVDEFRRAGWTIQSVNPAGSRGVESLLEASDGMLMLARETGGELYQNFNDLSAAMDSMLDKTSVTYLLAYQAENLPTDGSFRPIRVDLQDAPRGARALHRTGYYAPKPLAEEEGLESALETAELILSGEEGGELATSVLVASFKAPSAQGQPPSKMPPTADPYVTVWVDVDGEGLLAGQGERPVAFEIFGYLLDDSGEIRDFFSRRLELPAREARERLAAGLKFFADLRLPAGDYEMRLLVRNLTTGSYRLSTVPLEVADFARSGLVLLPPFLLADASGALLLREQAEPGEEEVDYPFTAGDQQFVPAARPIVDPGAQTRVCVMAYGLEAGELGFAARLLAADGGEIAGERLSVVGRSETSADGLDKLFLTLDPLGLEPGDYRLEVTVSHPDRGQTETRSVPFRVAG